MNICVFQGTFNPIHNAHLRVAKFCVDDLGYDKLIFIPAYCPPHKNSQLAPPESRFEMLKLAIQNNSKFDVSDIEYKRKGKSYTYLTIKELYEKYGKINFIIGTDAFRKIESWYEADKLKELVKFLIFTRDNDFDKTEFDYLAQKGYDFEFQSLTFEDISSSELRNKIKNGESIVDFVPKQVEEYIIENELYKD